MARVRLHRLIAAGWVPREHGSWAIALVPAFAGAWLARGSSAAGFLLVGAALVAFLALQAAGLWWRSRRRRYRTPAAFYCAGAGLALAALLVARPGLLAWWPLVAPPALALAGLTAAHRGAAPGTRLTGIATAALACPAAFDLGRGLRRADVWRLGDLHASGAAARAGVWPVCAPWLDAGAHALPGWPRTWAVTGLLFAYFAACLLHVHALVRARGSRAWQAASAGAHLAGLALAAILAAARLVSPWNAAVWALLAARAIGMPAAARRRAAPWRVATIGAVEFAACALVLVSALLAP